MNLPHLITIGFFFFFSNIIAQTYIPVSLDSFGIESNYAAASCFADINADGKIDFWNGGNVYLQDDNAHFMPMRAEQKYTGISCFGDYDNDNLPDIIHIAGNTIHLLKNMGGPDYKFKNVDTLTNLGMRINERQLNDIAWVDVNNDGLLDFYVSSYEYPPENSAIGHPDYLFVNDGNGKFVDVSVKSNIASIAKCSRGISILDYNNDGWQDIYVASYRLEDNVLWENQKDGTFKNVAERTYVQGKRTSRKYGHTIASAVADIDANGFLDIFTPITHHYGAPGDNKNHLYLNMGQPDFEFYDFEISDITNAEIGTAPAIIDLNNDGELDLFFINLYGRPWKRVFLYHNTGGVFTDQTTQSNLPRKINADFAHFVDLNKDGYLDIYTPIQKDLDRIVYVSDTITENNFISMILQGDPASNSNASALGARVYLWSNGQFQMQELNCKNGNGYGSMFNPILHFGLEQSQKLDSIQIKWPSQQLESYYEIEANQHIKIIESEGYKTIFSTSALKN